VKANAKGKLKKLSNNRGDLTEAQIKPTRTTAASDVAAITGAIRQEFESDIAARVASLERLQAERDKLEKAAAESPAGRQAWMNSGARIGLDSIIAEQRLALTQLYGGARPDLLAALAEVERRAASGTMNPPAPNDRAALRSVADGTYQSNHPDPRATLTSGQIRSLEKRLEKSTDIYERQRIGDELTRLKLTAAATAQFGNRPPLGIRGR
jgi:hypothetical protein